MHSQNTDDSNKEPKKNGFFDNVSFAAVISSALAAATSLFLSTKIGLAGSLIGAAVAAGASSLAMQVYQSILSKSAEKIHGLSSDNNKTTPNEQDGQATAGTDATTVQPYSSSLADTSTPYTTSASGTRIAPEQLRRAATSHQGHSSSKRAIIIALIAAFAALGITALVISFATAGQGIGSTTTFSSSTQEATTKNNAEETSSSPTNNSSESNSTAEKNSIAVNSNSSSPSSTTNSGSTSTDTSGATDTTNSSSTSNSSSSSSNSSSTNSSSSAQSNTSSGSNTSGSTSGNKTNSTTNTNSSTTTSNTLSTESNSTSTH